MEQRATNGGGDISPATQRLIAQLERLVADASRPSMKVPLLQRLAKTWERRAGRMEEALACVALAVALAPSDRRSRADMDRLVDEISDVESLEAAWERALGRADDDKTRNELMAQLARLLEERGETGRALARYENAVAAGLDDLVTLEGAARAFRHAGRWPQLADVLERLLDRSDGGDEKGERLKALADVYELQLHEPSRALFALESARADLGDTPELLLALDRLYESTGQPRPRVEILRQLAVLDPKEAAGHLSRALGLVDGLAEGTDDGDALTELRVHKAELLETAGDGAGAMSVLQDVLDADPDNRHALSVLGRLHFDEQRWEAAAPLLQQELAFLGESDEPAYRAELHRRSARCAVQSGDSALAAEHFDNANQLVPGELTTLLGLARAKRRLGRESEAHEHFESLLRLEGSEARTPIGREIRMAFLELELEPLRRLSLSEEILTNQGSNRTAARLRVESLLDLDRWSDGAEALAALIEDTEKAGSFDMSHLMSDLMRLSGLQREHLGDLDAAQATLEKITERYPEESPPLRALLELQVERGETDAALDTLERLMPLVVTDGERAAYHYMAAQLLADDEERQRDGIGHLVATVTLDLERRDALRAAEVLLTRLEDWEGLAAALGSVAAAALEQGATEVEFHLRRRLAEHHVEKTGDLAAAAEGLRRAIEIDPTHRSVHLQLSDVLEASGRREESVAVLRDLLAREPNQIEPWRMVARLFSDMEQTDGVRSALGVIVLSGEATEEERERLAEYPRPWLTAADKPVPRSALLHIMRGGEESSPVTEVMRLLYENLGDDLETPSLRSFGMGRGDEIESDRSLLFMRTLQATGRLLDVEPPRVFFDEEGGGFRVLPVRPPVLAVSSGILRGRRESDLAFLVGKGLALVQPEFALASLVPLASLKLLVSCARAYLEPLSYKVPVDGGKRRRVAAVVKELKRSMDDEGRERLAEAIVRVSEADVEDWVSFVMRQANHVGLLCAGDIVRAARLSNRPIAAHPSSLADREAIVDLALFAISPAYLELRQHLWR